ncbi:MAG: ankyrin repeat domain-containing protein [Gammaproteobacteria bacterium]
MTARSLLFCAALSMAACGGGVNILPEPFTRERADGKIPVKPELIHRQVQAVLDGMPEGEAEVARWQHIETDYHACRLASDKTEKTTEKVFADCMANRGYVYMYRIDAEQLHNDIEFEIEKKHDARIAAERKAEEDRIAAIQKVEEERLAAEKKRQEEAEGIRRQKALNDALADAVYAAAGGDIAEVKRLIDSGANVNTKTKDGHTLLHSAAGQGYTEIALVLNKAGVYIDTITNKGITPLHMAARYGKTETILALVRHGADINAEGDKGNTPLHFAAFGDYTETALALVNAGADINAKENEGWTPLHRAAGRGHAETILALIKAGADLFARSNYKATPLDVAIIFHGKDSSIALFLHKAMKRQRGKDRQKADELLNELE